MRAKHPHLGGVILALQEEPRHERAWARGAGGEEQVAKSLATYLDDNVCVLHDRRIPRSRVNIDHVAVAASGVWVIDAKRYAGRATVEKPLFGQSKLLIGGRDRSKLIDGLIRQVEIVRYHLARESLEVPVRGALCFVDTRLPTFGSLTFRGFPLLYPRRLAKRINARGPVTPQALDAVTRALAVAFPPA